jgi:hypothetical protein
LGNERESSLVDLTALQQTLDISFNALSLLEQALVHSCYVNEKPGIVSVSNERLEFLGDVVLGFVTAEGLYQLPGFRRQPFVESEISAPPISSSPIFRKAGHEVSYQNRSWYETS